MPSARELVSQFVLTKTTGADRIDIPALSQEAVAFLRGDPTLADAYMDETVAAQVAADARRVVGKTRHLIMINEVAQPRDALRVETAVRAVLSQWSDWQEYTGTHHVRVPLMTREELYAAAGIRKGRGWREIAIATVWEQLADGMQPGQRVEEVYTLAQIAEIARTISTRLTGPATDGPGIVANYGRDMRPDATTGG